MKKIALAILITINVFSVPMPIQAAQADDETLHLGIFPRRGAAMTEKMFTPLVNGLASYLGLKVTLETTHDFATFWQKVESGEYDIVHYNQYHYLRSHKDHGYSVFAHNVEFGHSKIAGALLVRKDSNINSIHDLKGKKIVFGGGRRAMQAYIATTYLLQQAGLREGDYFEHFALNPPKATIATFYHQASAAGAGNYVLELPHVQKQINISDMKYLATSEELAHLPWAVNPEVPEELVKRIRSFMVNLHNSDEGKAILNSAKLTRLQPAQDPDYDPHRHIVKSVLNEDL